MGKFTRAIELCSCIGALCIQLGKYMDNVIGIELDEKRIKMATSNSKIYGVSDKVNFIQGDVLDHSLLKKLQADIVFLDPGWSTRKMDRSSHVNSVDDTKPSLRKMFNLTRKYLTTNIVARIPATITSLELENLGYSRIENIHIDGILVFKVAYFLEDLSKSYCVVIKFK